MRYRPVSPKFWTDPKVIAWSDDQRLLALYLLTCPHRTTEGLFRLPVPYMLADLGWPTERFFEAFDQLLDDGLVLYDENTSVCLMPKALEYQTPENKNQAIGAARVLLELPHSPDLWRRFVELVAAHAPRMAAEMRVELAQSARWTALIDEVFGDRFMERANEEAAKATAEQFGEQSGERSTKPRTQTLISNPNPDEKLAPSQATDENVVAVVATKPTTRNRDELFEAVVAACGMRLDEITEVDRGPTNRAVGALRKVDADPRCVAARAQNYRLHFPEAALTPMALAKHWARCAQPPPPRVRGGDVLTRFAGRDEQ